MIGLFGEGGGCGDVDCGTGECGGGGLKTGVDSSRSISFSSEERADIINEMQT